jgi:two-component system cell cycle sensor histidine kinase/response regulator CckA
MTHETCRAAPRRAGAPPSAPFALGPRRRVTHPEAPSAPDFRALVESLPDIVARFDRQLRHVYVSPSVERATGRPCVEFIGRTNADLGMDPALAGTWDAALLRVFESGETAETSFRFDTPEGPRWYSARLIPERGAEGRVDTVVSLVRVVTEREEAARRLRESEARYRSMVESSLDGVMLMQPGGLILSANPAACRIFGRGEDELRREGLAAVVAPADRPIAAAAEEWRRTGRFSGRLVLRRADGGAFPADVSAAAFHDAAGRPCATVLVRDASDEVRADQALREREERFRALTENGSDVTTILGPDGTMQYVSPSVRSVLGLEPAELEGTSVMSMFHPDDAAGVAEAIAGIAATPGASAARAFRMRHADGSWRHFEGTGINLIDHPAVGGIVTNSRDVTERLRAEAALHERDQQLRQAQKMEAVGRLAGGIAHDFNNLLTAIKGNTQLMLLRVEGDAELRTELLEVDRAADRAAALTRQLLAFSRRQVLHPQVLELNDTVRGVQGMLRRLIPEPVELAVELADGLPAVEVDPGQIEQVVVNLAVNARDAMPRGGVLALRTAAVPPAEAGALGLAPRPLGYVRLEVADTGEGIAPEVLPHVFEPFFTTKEMGKGTGLGLSTVYGIVQQSGGRVDAASAPGQGSTFTVYLPAHAGAPAPAAARPPSVARRGGGEVVLLVEDEDSVRALTRRVLERSGYAVVEARNGVEALEIARGLTTVHAMLTDVVMPRMSGAELAVAIRDVHPGLRTVYMSGYAGDEIEALGLVEEGIPFLAKPFTVDELTRTLRQVLDGR